MSKTMQEVIDAIVSDRADWLVDAVATATQNRGFLRGDEAEDGVATQAILLNGEKAIRTALFMVISAVQQAGIKQ